MMPISVQCSHCGEFIYKGKKFNANVNPLDAIFQDSLITDNQKVKKDSALTKQDFQKQLTEFSKDRGYENSSNQTGDVRLDDFQRSLKQSQKRQEQELERRIKKKNMDNDVFKELKTNLLPRDNRLDFSDTNNPMKQKLMEAKQEREWQNYLDWRDWHDLDEASKQFVRNYLADEEYPLRPIK